MNVKAERMEQMIQVVNRNLQLVFSGESEGVTPLEVRNLEKVDAVVFGHDKFAFEMVHFVKSNLNKGNSNHSTTNKSIEDLWETIFVQGLETLLVECAVIYDDIERDCFVSRVYCWFTEKLQERRYLPRKHGQVANLRAWIERFGGDQTHTLRGLESYEKSIEQDALNATMNATQNQVHIDPNDRDFPTISVPEKKSRFGSRHVPQYVKQGFPNVLAGSPPAETFGRTGPYDSNNNSSSMFPKIPGAEENYGMLHNVPETAAEKAMHEMWMARRRQEAFEWKTQQHLALVMDRLALHKSRLESDALRRQESNTMIKTKDRPVSADALHRSSTASFPHRSQTKLAGIEQQSGQERSSTALGISTVRSATRMFRRAEDSPSPTRKSNRGSPERGATHPPSELSSHTLLNGNGPTTPLNTTVVMTGKGTEMEAIIPAPGRTSVAKPMPSKLPMHFKTALPDDFAQHQKFYLQLSDSDDDDKPERVTKVLRRTAVNTGNKGNNAGKKGGAVKAEVAFKHERPIDRERPISARMFHNVSANDPELKVHYRHTNYRRMPLTAAQEQWLDEREALRMKKSEEVALKLVENVAKKGDKKGSKGGGKDNGKKENKDKNSKKNKKDTTIKENEEIKIKSKYHSAAHAMSSLFPNFEDEENPSTLGPMRTMQLGEVSDILHNFQNSSIPIKENILRKALLIPQDRPEAICLEDLYDTKEGLMVNPNPKEFWRKFNMKKKSGKKGKKKK